MCAYRIEIQVDSDFADRVASEQLVRLARTILEQEKQSVEVGLTLVITDDQHIRALNRDYRGIDHATDVLSFPGGAGSQFVVPEEVPPYLGDVIVSFPTAFAQAAEQGCYLEEELALLVVHGVLHLLGYDHSSEEEGRRMWAREEEILRHWP